MKSFKEIILEQLNEKKDILKVHDFIKSTIKKTSFILLDRILTKQCEEDTLHHYAEKLILLLTQYAIDKTIKKEEQNKLEGYDKNNNLKFLDTPNEIKNDIRTIEKFLTLMKKNAIYNNDLERTYQNKQGDKFVYDYCHNLIDDLRLKKFNKSTAYARTLITANKDNIHEFFITLQKHYPKITSSIVKGFIDTIDADVYIQY